MSALTFSPTPLAGVWHIRRAIRGDARGSFARVFDAELLAHCGWTGPIQQVNHSHTAKAATLRGMHWQHPPCADWKLVTCVRGRVFDVGVDVRSASGQRLQWHGQILDAEQGDALLLPPGVAHGFQTLEDDVELIYCHSQPFRADLDRGLNPLDPALAVAWPLPVGELSDKDRTWPLLTTAFNGVAL